METRNCKNCKQDFTIEPDDFGFYEKLKVPPPTWCPHCRFIRKAIFVNGRSLYKGNCKNCNKSIISMYSPESAIAGWCLKCYLGDSWDACDYGKDYDFSRNFFDQFKELKESVPHRGLDQNERNDPNCEYSNFSYANKDVYLSFFVKKSEHIKYSNYVLGDNKNCLDSLIIKDNEKGYELVQASTNYRSSFLIESDRCIESKFLFDCTNCTNCCLSSNLRNKSFVFKNEQLTKEEYEEAIAALRLDTYSGQQKAKNEFENIAQKALHRHAHIKNSVNAVGDFIGNSKNVYNSYCLVDAEKVKNIFFGVSRTRDSQDMIFTGVVEECYEIISAGRGGNKIALSFSCGSGSKDLFYSDNCRNCSDCFGCAGLLKKQYCIFNKQYSKEEYFELVEKIKKQMNEMPYIDSRGREYGFGECFPAEISPFAYNETIAFEEFPLSKQEAISLGYKWRDPEPKLYTPTMKADDISDSIQDITDDITKEIIECPNQGKVETGCTSAFRILPDELAFYRQMNLPIPRYCPNCRYHDRLKWKNPFRFYERECMCELSTHGHEQKCSNEFETMYAPDRPEIIYCKECYQKEVY